MSLPWKDGLKSSLRAETRVWLLLGVPSKEASLVRGTRGADLEETYQNGNKGDHTPLNRLVFPAEFHYASEIGSRRSITRLRRGKTPSRATIAVRGMVLTTD